MSSYSPSTLRMAILVGGVICGGLFAPHLQAQTTTLTFDRIYWFDRLGTAHYLQRDYIEFWEQDAIVDDHIVTGPTGGLANGSTPGYISMSTTMTDAGDLELYTLVRAETVGAGSVVSAFGAANMYKERIPAGTGYWSVTEGSTTTFGQTIGNTAMTGKAITVAQAIKFAHDYFDTMTGGTASTPAVEVRMSSSFTGQAFAAGTQITIGDDVWADWDVIFHEYGHIIADNNNLDGPNLGLDHSFGVDNITRHGSNLNGTQLAWQEGIATYLGLSAVKDGNLATWVKGGSATDPGLPAQDTNEIYEDIVGTGTIVNSAPILSFNIETGGGNVGEGDEASVARILWDLYDTEDNADPYTHADHSDKWTLGAKSVWDRMGGNARLDQFWDDVEANHVASDEQRAQLGEVFQQYGVSAVPGVAPGVVDDATTADTTPTLAWNEQNSNHSSRFIVAIFNSDWSAEVLRSPELVNVTQWTVPAADALALGDYNWVVISNSIMQGAVDFNDSYWSGGVQFTIVPEPIALVSMGIGLAACWFVLRRRRNARSDAPAALAT